MTPFDPRLTVIAAAARVKTCHVYHCWQALREMGRRFHVPAFAHFAGLEEHHVTSILEALEANDALPDKRSPVTHRAHRLADDFSAPEDWIEWASRERRWAPADAMQEAEIFANFWQAKSGANATKLDWKKTWQNWVRNSRRPNGNYTFSTGSLSQADLRASMESTADLYDRMGRTTEAEEIRRKLSDQGNVLLFNRTAQMATG